MWAGLGVLAMLEGSLRIQIGYALATVLGIVAGSQVWLRQRKFEQNSITGYAIVHDSAVFESGDYGQVQIAMDLEFHGVAVEAGHRIYRVFRLPGRDQHHFAEGERLAVRVRPGDLTVVQIALPVEAGAKPRYVEARASRTPIDEYA